MNVFVHFSHNLPARSLLVVRVCLLVDLSFISAPHHSSAFHQPGKCIIWTHLDYFLFQARLFVRVNLCQFVLKSP